MRTVVLDALMVDVQTAVEGMEGARVVHGPEGKVWVQSVDFDRMQPRDLRHFVDQMVGHGISIEVLENQAPLPPECDDAG